MSEDYKIEFTSPLSQVTKGAEYEFRLSRAGISMLWEITVEDVIPGEFLRDRQSRGPFSLWVHTQKFEDHGQGTLLTDIVEYDVPFGLLGKLADDIFVRRDLKKIFQHRHQKISHRFALQGEK